MSAAELPLPQVRHWVFDMDGTLTVAAHDFARIRRELGMPADADILQQLANWPPAQAQAARAWLWQHEHALARTAQPAPGALALVHALHAGGCRLGILTRNTRALAQLTLAAIGLDECFAEAEIIGRDELPAKPDPAGLHYFAERWQVAPGSMCMVGDHYYDLACAQAAGVPSVLVNLADDPWLQLRGWRLPDCQALLAQWQGGDPAGTWPDCR